MEKTKVNSFLETERIGRLMRKFSLPCIISLLVGALYNIVDQIFIANADYLGSFGNAANSVVFPLTVIALAIATMIGDGCGAFVSIRLGAKDFQKAHKSIGNSVLLTVASSIVLMVIYLIFADRIITAFGGTVNEETFRLSKEYFFWISLGVPFYMFGQALNPIIRSDGNPRFAMITLLVGAISNCILDPIFIFELDMGVRGAALATVISQAIAVVWQFTIFCNPKELLHFHRRIWKLDKQITLHALSIGLSPFLTNLASCFVVIIINNQLKRYGGDMAIATYGVINRVVFVFAMIVMGLNQGMQPIVGYNYGAKQYHRMLRTFKLTAICATITTSIVFVLGEFCPELVVRVFTHDAELIAQSVAPMRIICCSMLIVGFQMVAGNLFTSIGMASKAIFLSLTRQVLYLIPLTLFVPLLFTNAPLLGVWWSQPISDTLAAITAAIMLWVQIRKFKALIQEQDAYLTTVPPQPD